MAEKQVKTVTLLDKNGNDFVARTPAEVSNLVFGSGYRVKDKNTTVDQAMATLMESGPVAEELAAQQEIPVNAPASGKKA